MVYSVSLPDVTQSHHTANSQQTHPVFALAQARFTRSSRHTLSPSTSLIRSVLADGVHKTETKSCSCSWL